MTREELLEQSESFFPPLDGTALLSLVCSMNHSCDPNVQIVYNECCGEPLLATVIALREIKDEEVNQEASRIDTNEDLASRREKLRDYGFLCMCPRCQKGGGG